MKRRRFDEEQIIRILKEHEGVQRSVDLCRKHGISSATCYKWKAKYVDWRTGGSEASKLKALEDETSG